VPSAERDTIWRPFQRGSAARDGAGGSGIGLTVVKEILNDHEGRAWVEDGASGGAVFVVELPVTYAPAAGTRAVRQDAAAVPRTAHLGPGT
jgi:two-component system OmpR family sensor kinase